MKIESDTTSDTSDTAKIGPAPFWRWFHEAGGGSTLEVERARVRAKPCVCAASAGPHSESTITSTLDFQDLGSRACSSKRSRAARLPRSNLPRSNPPVQKKLPPPNPLIQCCTTKCPKFVFWFSGVLQFFSTLNRGSGGGSFFCTGLASGFVEPTPKWRRAYFCRVRRVRCCVRPYFSCVRRVSLTKGKRLHWKVFSLDWLTRLTHEK